MPIPLPSAASPRLTTRFLKLAADIRESSCPKHHHTADPWCMNQSNRIDNDSSHEGANRNAEIAIKKPGRLSSRLPYLSCSATFKPNTM